MTTLLKSKRTKARKEHRCSFCDDVQIKTGEEYLYRVYTDSGEFWVWKMCDFCTEIMDEFCDPQEEYNEGDCWNVLESVGEEEIRKALTGEYLARALRMMEV